MKKLRETYNKELATRNVKLSSKDLAFFYIELNEEVTFKQILKL
jgi:hypothetical protein